MRSLRLAVILLLPAGALAQPEYDLLLEGDVPADAPPYFTVPFEVPEGVVEIEVRHDDLSDRNILDFGLLGPDGAFRGWGGGNPEPLVVGEAGASRSYLPGPIEAGTWSLLVGQAKILDAPGQYSAQVYFRTEPTLPAAETGTYDLGRVLQTGARWYAGDFHVHSLDSGDAEPSLDTISAFAAERGLDFVVITDHNTTAHLPKLSAAEDRGGVLLIPGIEVTTYQGHLGAFGVTGFVDFRFGQDGRGVSGLSVEAAQMGALLSVNHPALDLGDACIGCAWTHEGSIGDFAGVEIQTGANRLFTQEALRFWDDRIDDTGVLLAALGGSDDHKAGMNLGTGQSPIGTPTTMVFAEALSAEAILAGVRDGRTVVKLTGPDGPMVELGAEDLLVTAHVTDASGLQLLWVVDGQLASAVDLASDDETVTFTAESSQRVRAELWDGESPVTITSHLRVVLPLNDIEVDGPCACGTVGEGAVGGGPLAAAGLALVGALRRRRWGRRPHPPTPSYGGAGVKSRL